MPLYKEKIEEVVETSIYNADREFSNLTYFAREIFGLTSFRLKHFLNNFCTKIGNNLVYTEFGIYRGATILSVALSDSVSYCYGLDSFSYDPYTAAIWNENGWKNIELAAHDNLERAQVNQKIKIIKCDVRDTSVNYANLIDKKSHIIFWDVDFLTKKELFEGLNNVYNMSTDTFVLILGNYNDNKITQTACKDFLEQHKLIVKYKKEIPSTTMGNKDSWWSGIGIFLLEKMNKDKK